MTEATAGRVHADFTDGRSARIRRVDLQIDDGSAPSLILTPAEAPARRWALADIRAVPGQADADGLVLTVTQNALARLYIDNPHTAAELAALCPNLSSAPPVRGVGRILGWAAAAVSSVALIVFVLVPILANQLATVLPPAGEKALGDATLEQVRSALDRGGVDGLRICDSRDGRAALDRMRTRLTEGVDLPYPLTVTVLDHDMINAFALPGGHVVFFRGLIDAAQGPDEVAAVFAHELGHVVARDPVRIAMRSAGSIGVLGLLLGDFAGGAAVLFLTERLIQASYTRGAEGAADSFAHDRLIAAGIRPGALGTLFETLLDQSGEPGGIVAHFMSHPELGDRIDAARKATEGATTDFTPALDPASWQALQTICD